MVSDNNPLYPIYNFYVVCNLFEHCVSELVQYDKHNYNEYDHIKSLVSIIYDSSYIFDLPDNYQSMEYPSIEKLNAFKYFKLSNVVNPLWFSFHYGPHVGLFTKDQKQDKQFVSELSKYYTNNIIQCNRQLTDGECTSCEISLYNKAYKFKSELKMWYLCSYIKNL